MAKRTHTTELGCVACDELSELGAGKPGWLVANPNLLCALDTHSLAIANRSLILTLGWSDSGESRVKIRPDLSPIEAEYISAIEWLVFDDIRVIVVGTSCGFLLLYSLRGELIHKQLIYPGRILKLRVRGTKRDLIQETSSEEVCVVMSGVIARFYGSEIQSMLQQWFHDSNSRFWEKRGGKQESDDFGNSYGRLSYQLWNVSKSGKCADAAISGIMPPPLMELQSNQRYYCAVTIGEDAVISAFRLVYRDFIFFATRTLLHVIWTPLSEDIDRPVITYHRRKGMTVTLNVHQPIMGAVRALCFVEYHNKEKRGFITLDKSRSLVGAIISRVVPATFSTIASLSKMIWRSEQTSPKKPNVKPQSFARASPLTSLKDYPRKGEKLTLSPSGTLAAITDSLGRILLLDTQALVVVRLWKGYRDASCLFMEMLVSRDTGASTSAYKEHVKSDYCLCLAIHAPRKEIIEIWQMRTGARLRTIPCPKGSKILQPTYRFGSSATSPYIPLEVFVLNGDSGQISVINRTLG